MRKNDWTRYLLAAALVLLIGAAWALAETKTMKVEVHSDGGQEITIDVNGVVEVIKLDDLAEGEERTFDVGGHPIVVKRANDNLMLVHEGAMKGHIAPFGEGEHNLFFVTEGGEGQAFFVGDGDAESHRVIVIKKGEGGEDCEIKIEKLKERFGDELQTIEIEGAPHRMMWHSTHGEGGPFIVKSGSHFQGGDFVHYRCEETGSMLTVKKDENLLDDYIDPVTGCLMEKVDGPNVRVMTILHEIKEEGEDVDD